MTMRALQVRIETQAIAYSPVTSASHAVTEPVKTQEIDTTALSSESPIEDQNQAITRDEADFPATSLNFTPTSEEEHLQTEIDHLKERMQANIKQLASQTPENFNAILKQAFGDKITPQKQAELLELAKQGQFPLPENIQFLDPTTLQGADGAYSPINGGTLFLDQTLLSNPDRLFQVFTEEAAHHLDNLLGEKDAEGDEGEIFAKGLAQGEPLNNEELLQAKIERDQGTITVNGQELEVEFVLPAIPVVAAYLAKTGAAISADFAIEFTIAALTGVPPSKLSLITDAALNLIPGFETWKKAKKFKRLEEALTKVQTTINAIRQIPGGHKIFESFKTARANLDKAIKNWNAPAAKAALDDLLGAIQSANKISLPPKISIPIVSLTQKIGAKIGSGGNKEVFEYGKDQAIAVLKKGQHANTFDNELKVLEQIKNLGFPTVAIRGQTSVNGQAALIMDRFAQGSKDIVRTVNGKVQIVGTSPYLNQRSIEQLKAIRARIVDEKVQIHDLQFLIKKNGDIVISDPLKVTALTGNAQAHVNLSMIDQLIKAAQRNP